MNKLTDDELWSIIDDIDWKGACIKAKTKKRPYDIVAEAIVKNYSEYLLEIREFARNERLSIKIFLSNNNISTGNDSGWDLTAHIIGCGKDYIEEVKKKVLSGEYTNENIYKEIKYKENFEYSFGVVLEKIVGDRYWQTADDKYKEWLRNRKIDNLINQ